MVLRLLSDLLPAAGMAGAADAALSDQQRGAAGVSARGRGAPPTGGPTPDGLGRPRGATALSRMLPRPIWRGGSCNRPRCCAGTGTWFGAAGATHTGVGVQAWRWRSGLWCCGWLGRTRPGGTAASTVSSAGSATRLGPAPSGLSRHRRRRRRRPRPASQSALGVPLADRLEEKQAKQSLQAATWSFGSPRRDSNPRPSDYESVPNLPPGPLQTHPGCSGAGPISSRAVLYRLVVTPGLPERLPHMLGERRTVLRRLEHPIAIGCSH